MNQTLVLSILSDDKPGIVETLANTINEHNGNWLESRLSSLAGKFAGILEVSVPQSHSAALKSSLSQLASKGIIVATSDVKTTDTASPHKALQFNLVGNDRPGIIRELSQTFVEHNISLDELHTNCTSMPWSGDPMFTAHGIIHLTDAVNEDQLSDTLNDIADELGVDIELDEIDNTEAQID